VRKKIGVLLGSAVLALGVVGGGYVTAVEVVEEAEASQQMVELCHAAGLEGTTQFVTLTIAYNAAFGEAGHFNEDGTTRAGHEQDYLGACVEMPPPTCEEDPTQEGCEEDPPPTTTEPDPVEVTAGVTFVDGTCETAPFIDVLEVQGVVYVHDNMIVGDHEVPYLSSGTIIAQDAAEDDDVELVGQTEFPFAFTFDPFAEGVCREVPPPIVCADGSVKGDEPCPKPDDPDGDLPRTT